MNKPNIIFFFTDDQRFDTINALGNKDIITPNMDWLVNNGTAFTHAHIPGGTVAAVCMPSRAMLHTGRTLFHIEGEGQNISENYETIGETFRKNGYTTFGTGKWHNGVDSYARSFSCGGEIFFGGMEDHWNVPACCFDPFGKYNTYARKTSNYYYSNQSYVYNCDHVAPGKHSSELFCDAAANFLDIHDTNDPFFMYVSFMAPHDPRTMPQYFMDMYKPEDIVLPPNYMEKHPFVYGIENIRDELLALYPRTEAEIRKHVAEYYAMITHLDHEMGRVIQKVKEKGLLENTIFVLAGDNGLAIGQHGLMGKQSLYEHSIRVPLVFCGSGIPKGQTLDTYVYLMDIFPTMCDLISVDIPETVEGKSLCSVMNGDKEPVREYLYLAYADSIRGIKERRYKLIEYASENIRKTQLFDLQEDPWEMKDLSPKEEFKETMDRIRCQLLEMRDRWDDNGHPMGEKYWSRYS
jgi:arylsulfatase A-like enzyme